MENEDIIYQLSKIDDLEHWTAHLRSIVPKYKNGFMSKLIERKFNYGTLLVHLLKENSLYLVNLNHYLSIEK